MVECKRHIWFFPHGKEFICPGREKTTKVEYYGQERANGRTADIPINILTLPENHNISIAGSWKKGTRFRQERSKSLRCGNVSGKSTRTWRMASNPMEIR